jgi:3',5'-cyclic AMP phosphodiesterase CpdA
MGMKGDGVRLGIVSDSHFCPAGTPPGFWHNPQDYDRAEERLELGIRLLQSRNVDAVAMLGDLTNFGDEASIARAVAVLASAGVPVLVVPGNHDCLLGVTEFLGHVDRLGPPGVMMAGTEHELGGIRVVGLTELARDEEVKQLVIADIDGGNWGDGPLVVLTHFPLLDRRAAIEGVGWKYAGGFRDAGVARRLRDRRGPAIILHGHLHVRDATLDGNVLQIGCAALVEPPHEATVVEIDRDEDGGWRVPVEHTALATSEARLPVMTPARGAWRFAGEGWTVSPAS